MAALSIGDRLAGAVWGQLVGDAVGVPYEFQKPPTPAADVRFGAEGTWGQPPGTWSDDGALMLAFLGSLLDKGFNTTDQAQRALAWYRHGTYAVDEHRFDVGNATRHSLERFEQGVQAEDAGNDPNGLGNGSLMRILPLALVERGVPTDTLVDHAHRASKVTHGAVGAQVSCALYVLIALKLLEGRGGRSEALSGAQAELRRLYESGSFASQYRPALDELEAWPDRGGRGFVIDSFWSAWDAFAGADSYDEAIRRAVAYGTDTDTTAAIAGGLAGIRWGIDGIPAEWLAGMRDRNVVWTHVLKLIEGAGLKNDEIRVDWVDFISVPGLRESDGRLGMTFLPGKRDDGMTGKHWRVLEEDARTLKAAHGVDTLVLLVEDKELVAAHVVDIQSALQAHGIEPVRFPIVDGGVPSDIGAFRSLIANLSRRLNNGKTVVIACRGGCGRTGTTVACMLRDAGMDGDAAIALTKKSRHCAIENGRQAGFVRAWPFAHVG